MKLLFKLPDEWIERQKEIYELKYITYQGRKIHVSELEDRSVTPEMRSEMRMNSYAQDDLPPKLNDAALIKKAKQYLGECNRTRIPCSTYDEALIHNIVPELIKRLEETEDNMNLLKSVSVNKLAMDLEHVLINTETVDPDTSVFDFLKILKDING
jgi:hypothetical protein